MIASIWAVVFLDGQPLFSLLHDEARWRDMEHVIGTIQNIRAGWCALRCLLSGWDGQHDRLFRVGRNGLETALVLTFAGNQNALGAILARVFWVEWRNQVETGI